MALDIRRASSWIPTSKMIRFLQNMLIRSRFRGFKQEPALQFVGKWACDNRAYAKWHRVVVESPLSYARLLPSIDCETLWKKSHRIDWPPVCCACGQPGEFEVDYFGVGPRWLRRRQPVVCGVPHCGLHHALAEGNALLHVDIVGFESEGNIFKIIVHSTSQKFLRALIEQIESSPMLPPWDAFLWPDPDNARFNQGTQEVYVELWRIMFDRLSESEQSEYLARAGAPDIWQDWARK